MPRNNSAARRKERREEAKARNERNAGSVIDCFAHFGGGRHHKDWAGCPVNLAHKEWSK